MKEDEHRKPEIERNLCIGDRASMPKIRHCAGSGHSWFVSILQTRKRSPQRCCTDDTDKLSKTGMTLSWNILLNSKPENSNELYSEGNGRILHISRLRIFSVWYADSTRSFGHLGIWNNLPASWAMVCYIWGKTSFSSPWKVGNGWR